MDGEFFRELAEEIKRYKERKEYAQCIRRIEEHQRNISDPVALAILLIAKSTCAADLGDFATAENAAFAIDVEPLTLEMRNYVNLTKANVAESVGKLELAESLYCAIIASKETHAEQQPDALYEALARLGFLYANRNRFVAALNLLQKADLLIQNGDLHDSVGIYIGYCLQALNRLDEATECLQEVLHKGSGELIADAYYRLGAVQLQTGDCESAIESFQGAQNSLPHGNIAKSEILAALQECKKQMSINSSDMPCRKSRPKPRVQ